MEPLSLGDVLHDRDRAGIIFAGLLKAAVRAVELAEIVKGLGDLGMVLAAHLLADRKHPLVQFLGLRAVPQRRMRKRDVI